MIAAGVMVNCTFHAQVVNEPGDTGSRGHWIVTIPTEVYAATLGKWFGADDVHLAEVFARRQHFNQYKGGFGVMQLLQIA